MAKSEQTFVSNTTQQLRHPGIVSMLNPLLSCIRRKPNLCIQMFSGPTQLLVFYFFTIFGNNIERRTSHGQVTRLLQVPFLCGPSGRSAFLWIMLSPLTSSIHDRFLLKHLCNHSAVVQLSSTFFKLGSRCVFRKSKNARYVVSNPFEIKKLKTLSIYSLSSLSFLS